MKLTRIEGAPQTLVCAGCKKEGVGGSKSYQSASTNEERWPDEWYQNDEEFEDHRVYCSECAAKMVQEDPTRAIHQFYSDTAGKEIEPEIIQDL